MLSCHVSGHSRMGNLNITYAIKINMFIRHNIFCFINFFCLIKIELTIKSNSILYCQDIKEFAEQIAHLYLYFFVLSKNFFQLV